MSAISVRPAERKDLEAITALYNHFVETTAVTFDVGAFTVEAREPWFAQFGAQGPHRLFVAERGGVFAGYAGSMAFKAKKAYATSVETTIYVPPELSRCGAGKALYERLFYALAGEDVHRAYAGIALPNDASIRFHEGFGFREIGTYHEVGRKFGRYHDVRWFEKRL
ncbi:N-acetyltransferase family protein [Hyphococcus sp.]|uniref:GNAT family N-acetyltransferase n=1 Tax=Hyphococcus sp. TaxID=2038636 RepID=UPI003D146C0F